MLNPLLISLLRPTWTSSHYPAEAPIHIVATTLWHKFCIRDMHHYTPEAFPLFQMPRRPCSRRLFEGSVRVAVTKRHGKAISQRDATDPGLWIDAIRHSLGAEIFSLSRLECSTEGWPPPPNLEQYIASKIARNRVKYSDSSFYCHDSEDLPHIVLCLGGPKDVLAEFWRMAGSILGVVNVIILIKSKIPFVTPNWLTNSYVESKILPPEEYNLNSSLLKAADRIVDNWQNNGTQHHYLSQMHTQIPPTPILSQQQHIAELNSLTLTSFSSFLATDRTSSSSVGSIILTSIPGFVTNCLLAFLELNCGPKLMSWTSLFEIPDEFAYIRFLVVEKMAVRFCPYFNDTPAQPIVVIVQPEEVPWISDFYEALCHSLATYFQAATYFQSTSYFQSKCHQHDALGRLTVFLATSLMQKARNLIRETNVLDVLDIARSLLLVVNEAKISKSKELKLIVSDQVVQETHLHQKQQQLVLVAISRWLSGVLVENLENQLENCAIVWKVKTYIEALKITSKFKPNEESLSQEIVPVEAEPHNSLNHV